MELNNLIKRVEIRFFFSREEVVHGGCVDLLKFAFFSVLLTRLVLVVFLQYFAGLGINKKYKKSYKSHRTRAPTYL